LAISVRIAILDTGLEFIFIIAHRYVLTVILYFGEIKMPESFKQQLQELINRAAKKTVKEFNNIDEDEVSEFGTDIYMFKQGCEFLMPVLMKAVEQRDLNHECSVGGSYIKNKNNKDLLNILKGEK